MPLNATQRQKNLLLDAFTTSNPEEKKKSSGVKGYMRSTNTSENKVVTSPNISINKKPNSRNSSKNNKPTHQKGSKKMFNSAGMTSQIKLGLEA